MHNTTYLLIHGFCASKHSFDMLKLALLEQDPTSLILTPELKGHGASSETFPLIDSERTYEAYIQDMEEKIFGLIEQFQIEQFVLVGHSLGGAVALALSTSPRLQAYISRMVLINPALTKPKKLEGYKYFEKIQTYFTARKGLLQGGVYTIQSLQQHRIGKKLLDRILYAFTIKRYRNYIEKKNVYTTYTSHFYATQQKSLELLSCYFLSALNFLKVEQLSMIYMLQSCLLPTIILHGNKDDRFLGTDLLAMTQDNTYISLELFDHLNHNAHEEDPYLIARFL